MALGYSRLDDIPITLSTVMQSIIDDKQVRLQGLFLHPCFYASFIFYTEYGVSLYGTNRNHPSDQGHFRQCTRNGSFSP